MPRLRIVSVNDVYSLENLPRLKTLVRHYAESDPADVFLVTLAGDFLAPSILSSLDAGRGMVDCLNEIGITHVTFGNHEDDVPTPELYARAKELHAVWLATNLRGAPVDLPRSVVIDVKGIRVGLLGVVMNDPTVYRRPPFGALEVLPADAAAKDEAARLRGEQRCDCVIPLTHQTAVEDRALARAQRDPPFPLILGGHEHTVLMELLAGTWIVKAGSDAAHAVVTELTFDPVEPRAADDTTRRAATPPPLITVRVDEVSRYAEDAALRARVDTHMQRVHDLEAATLIRLRPGESLSSVGTRANQTSLGTLICTHVKHALEAEACLFNGGGIRAARDYPVHFTYGDLKAEVPFENEVVVADLPGRVVLAAVLASREHAPAESGGFLQVDDAMVVLEPSHIVTRIDGAPIDLARDYRVALVRDLFLGLDHNEALVRFAHEHPEKIPAAGAGRDVKMVLVDAFSVALWHELGGFDAVDTNRDNVVSEDELEAAVAKASGEARSAVAAGLILHALDTNKDQVISREEAARVEKRPRR